VRNIKILKATFLCSVLAFSFRSFSIIDDSCESAVETEINGIKVSVVQGDITSQSDFEYADAIVNPANQLLQKGGGVCGAIFAKAGIKLKFKCEQASKNFEDGLVPVGSAVITGGCLFDHRIIHVVPPNFNPNNFMQPSILFDEAGKKILEKSYIGLLRLAQKENVEKVAVPFLSGGNFCRVPSDKNELAAIALDAVFYFCKHEKKHGIPKEIRFVLYGDDEYDLFVNEFENYIE